MNNFASDMMGLSPIFALMSFVLVGFVSTTPVSLLLAILAGNGEKTEMLSQHLVTQMASATTLCRDLRLGLLSTLTALAKGITTLAIGTVVVPLGLLIMVAFAAYKAGEYMVNTTTNTYRKVRTSLKARILNWLGVTAEINQLKRENAKLQLQVRRLEILNDVNVVEDSRQAEANEMAQTLDAEFRAQLDALDASDLIGVWMGLDLGDSIASGQFTRDMVTDEIMGRIPMERSAAMQAVRQ